jgi:cytochrome c2
MGNRRFHGAWAIPFGLLILFAVVFTGCESREKKEAALPGTGAAKPEPASAAKTYLVSDLLRGRKIFEAKNCAQCHSIFERERKIGPKLAASRFYGSFLDIFSILWNHAPAMEAHMRTEVLDRPQFNAAELNELISFLYMLPYLGESGDPKKGATLLRLKACFDCHSLGDRGKRDGVRLDSPRIAQSQVVLLQRMWNHSPEMLGRMAKTGTRIPAFSANEMADLFAALAQESGSQRAKVFLKVGDVEDGEKLFTVKGCIQCHSIHGKGGKEAPDLGKTVRQSNVTMLITRLWNHAPKMGERFRQKKLAWPHFSETEMNDLIAFLYSLGYEDPPGDPRRGEKVFAREGCVNCHFKTEGGKRKIIGAVKGLNGAQFAALLWNHVPDMETAMVSQGVPWPVMAGDELRDVMAFLQGR